MSVGQNVRSPTAPAGAHRIDAANRASGEFNNVSRKIDNQQRRANRGIVASAALVNGTPYLPAKLVLNAGLDSYRGRRVMGVGLSRRNESGRIDINAGISATESDRPIPRLGMGVVSGD